MEVNASVEFIMAGKQEKSKRETKKANQEPEQDQETKSIKIHNLGEVQNTEQTILRNELRKVKSILFV